MERRVQRSSATGDVEPLVADRPLPQSHEAEQCVLGAILLDPSVASTVLGLLTERDFFSIRHQRVFRVIQELYDQLTTVDPVLVRDLLEQKGQADEAGGIEYLDELMRAVSSVANADYHARRVKERAILRHLITVCSGIIQSAYESDSPAFQQLDRAEHSIMEIRDSGETREFVEIRTVIDVQFDQLDKGAHGLQGILTGFHDLDDKTNGLKPSEFIIVAGRPSMGKTTFCMNVVERVAVQGHAVAIFSLEVGQDQLVQNLLCSFGKVDAQQFRKNALSPGQWSDLVEAAEKLRELKIYVDDTPGLTPLALKAKARRLHQRQKLDLVIIDYLQLMEGSETGENRQQEVAQISRSLKAMARELKVPVIAISQLSRGVESRESHRPRLSDLRESGAIEQDADLVLLLYREEYYYPDKEEIKGKAEAIIAKQRNGPVGNVPLTFISHCMRFENFARQMGV